MKRIILLLSAISILYSCSKEDAAFYTDSSSYAYLSLGDASGDYTNTENYEDYGENPFVSTSTEATSTFAIDADGGSYSNARRYLNLGQLPPTESVRIEEFINYFQYDYPSPTTEEVSVNTEVTTCPWYDGHYLLRIGLKGKPIPENTIAGSNFVFLIDVSGSMSSPDKLEMLKAGFKMLVDEMDSGDKISIVTYAGSAGVLLYPTPCSEKDKIKDAISSLGSGGSTAGAEGIITAYNLAEENFIENGNNRVIIGSDGDFNVGPSSVDELVSLIESKRDAGIYLTVLGVGQGNLNDAMMEQIANNGNGNYEYIDNVEQLRKVFIYEQSKFYTVAKDCKIQIHFDSTKVQAYRLIGYENRVLENEEYSNDSTDAGEIGADQTITALYELVMNETAQSNQQIATIGMRYKNRDSNTSKPFNFEVGFNSVNFSDASENSRFVTSVAAFGMLLKNSEYSGTANFDQVQNWAENATVYDPYGFRSEFIQLIGTAMQLD